MKHILLLGAGKSATCLIDYLIAQAPSRQWHITVADANAAMAQSKTGNSPDAQAAALDVENGAERKKLLQGADIVISLLPPALHYLVAIDCIALQKNLLTASYIDDRLRALSASISSKGLLFLCETGLDPGIDHMSAMQLIHRIKKEGGVIRSFKSHTGGLVAPESDDNPWHYKISWNPRNIVRAGSSGAIYKEDGRTVELPYTSLFDTCREVRIEGGAEFAYYPNRDSLSYASLYALDNVPTFIRTTLRHPDFCRNWKCIVAAGLTDPEKKVEPGTSFREWSKSILPLMNDANANALGYLGLFDDNPVPASASSSADVLQYLLETKLAMQPNDKDMIVMLHEIGYERSGKQYAVQSSLIVKGENSLHTAMAKTVGLPLGIAAGLVLDRQINLTGLHIPILPEIYEPVLAELALNHIRFNEVIREEN